MKWVKENTKERFRKLKLFYKTYECEIVTALVAIAMVAGGFSSLWYALEVHKG